MGLALRLGWQCLLLPLPTRKQFLCQKDIPGAGVVGTCDPAAHCLSCFKHTCLCWQSQVWRRCSQPTGCKGCLLTAGIRYHIMSEVQANSRHGDGSRPGIDTRRAAHAAVDRWRPDGPARLVEHDIRGGHAILPGPSFLGSVREDQTSTRPARGSLVFASRFL